MKELANLKSIQHVRMNALKGADKDSFEVAFHEVERRLLAGGCVRKVTNQNTPSGHVTTILTSDWLRAEGDQADEVPPRHQGGHRQPAQVALPQGG